MKAPHIQNVQRRFQWLMGRSSRMAKAARRSGCVERRKVLETRNLLTGDWMTILNIAGDNKIKPAARRRDVQCLIFGVFEALIPPDSFWVMRDAEARALSGAVMHRQNTSHSIVVVRSCKYNLLTGR